MSHYRSPLVRSTLLSLTLPAPHAGRTHSTVLLSSATIQDELHQGLFPFPPLAYAQAVPSCVGKDNSSHLTWSGLQAQASSFPQAGPISEAQRGSWQNDSFLEVGLGPRAESVTPSKGNRTSLSDTFSTSTPL